MAVAISWAWTAFHSMWAVSYLIPHMQRSSPASSAHRLPSGRDVLQHNKETAQAPGQASARSDLQPDSVLHSRFPIPDIRRSLSGLDVLQHTSEAAKAPSQAMIAFFSAKLPENGVAG
jgi:hypothetical protein